MANGHGGKREGGGGRQPGAGRPRKEVVQLRQEFQEKCLTEWTTAEDLQYIWQMTLGLAKRGDTAARADVFKYLLGQPIQQLELSGHVGITAEHKGEFDFNGFSAVFREVAAGRGDGSTTPDADGPDQ